jgi:hypothetical protein
MVEDIPYDGFQFERWFNDMNAAGGRRRRVAYYVTNEAFDEPEGWRLIDQGAGVLKAARDLGVGNNDFRIFDAE